MQQNKEKLQTFTQLRAWQEAHHLVLIVYKLTKNFPKEELFALVNQIRRAVVSVTSNIAEGFHRSSYKDKIHFYNLAYSSLTEAYNQLILSKDLDYIKSLDFEQAEKQLIIVAKLINAMITKCRSFISNTKY